MLLRVIAFKMTSSFLAQAINATFLFAAVAERLIVGLDDGVEPCGTNGRHIEHTTDRVSTAFTESSP